MKHMTPDCACCLSLDQYCRCLLNVGTRPAKDDIINHGYISHCQNQTGYQFVSALISCALQAINSWHHFSVKRLYLWHSRGTLSLDPLTTHISNHH